MPHPGMSAKSAMDLAKKRANFGDIIACRINGVTTDISSAIQSGDEIEFLTFDDDDGKKVFWDSSAHVLAYAITNLFRDAKLSHGSATSDGFFYDVKIDRAIVPDDLKRIEDEMNSIIKRGYAFTKEFYDKKDLLNMYSDNRFKLYYIGDYDNTVPVCKIGDFVDVCHGPHVLSTDAIKSFKLLKNSSSYFLGDANEESLQKIYAVSFPSEARMVEYVEMMKACSMMDHRDVGPKMGLFFFHAYSPGSCFFLPDGATIYNRLIEFVREEYRRRGFKEVITPNVFSVDLWKRSGHFDNYRENMFILEEDGGTQYGLKPMNCPGHCVMFKHKHRSYKELPLRLADFGVLHRNELSGTLSGLTRVRRFQQDDAHIFCTADQLMNEVHGCLDFLDYVYKTLGFTYELFLGTRPEKFLGRVEEWDAAESALKESLKGRKYAINEKDGAFYGPKIDINIMDSMKRRHQCATIQLDFQLPQRFDLKYQGRSGSMERPIIIHRAILGSIERIIAILVESYGKNVPFWLSPRQMAIVPISESFDDVGYELADFFAEFSPVVVQNTSGDLSKVIKSMEYSWYFAVITVGEREKRTGFLSVRMNGSVSTYKKEDLLAELRKLKSERRITKRCAGEHVVGSQSS